MKILAILGIAVSLPLLLIASLAGMGLFVFAVFFSPILLALGLLGAAVCELGRALYERRQSTEPRPPARAMPLPRPLAKTLVQR